MMEGIMGMQNGGGPPGKKTAKVAAQNSAQTGTPKNGPAKPARTRFDDVFQGGGEHDGGYGQNRYAGASSTPMNSIPESKLAADLRTTAAQNADGGDVLSTIQRFGAAAMRNPLPGDDVEDVKGTPAGQIRKIGKGAPPDAFGMASSRARQPSSYPGANGTVPGALTDDAAPPAGKPGA